MKLLKEVGHRCRALAQEPLKCCLGQVIEEPSEGKERSQMPTDECRGRLGGRGV